MLTLIGALISFWVIYNWIDNFNKLLIERGWIKEPEESKKKKQIQEAQKMLY